MSGYGKDGTPYVQIMNGIECPECDSVLEFWFKQHHMSCTNCHCEYARDATERDIRAVIPISVDFDARPEAINH